LEKDASKSAKEPNDCLSSKLVITSKMMSSRTSCACGLWNGKWSDVIPIYFFFNF